MRLLKPGVLFGLKKHLKLILVVILSIGLIIIAWKGLHKYKHRNDNAPPKNASSSTIDFLKDSSNLNDQRSVASEYIAAGDYENAETTAKQVAEKSGNTNDYLTLLNICTVYKVSDQQACIKQVLDKVVPQINRLSFYSVYIAGSELDKAGDKNNALIFYKRAYEIYDPVRAGESMKTKDQLKQRIDELNE